MIRYRYGFALVSTLLILLIITILLVSIIQFGRVQEKISASIQDKALAFNAAESTLFSAETWLLNQSTEPSTLRDCLSYPCLDNADLTADYTQKSSDWWQNHAVSPEVLLNNNLSSSQRYFIEFIEFVPDTPMLGNAVDPSRGVYYYRIIARATGPYGSGVAILQSTVARRY